MQGKVSSCFKELRVYYNSQGSLHGRISHHSTAQGHKQAYAVLDGHLRSLVRDLSAMGTILVVFHSSTSTRMVMCMR